MHGWVDWNWKEYIIKEREEEAVDIKHIKSSLSKLEKFLVLHFGVLLKVQDLKQVSFLDWLLALQLTKLWRLEQLS